MKKLVKRALQRPADALIYESGVLPGRLREVAGPLLIEEPAVAAKFLPYEGGRGNYIIEAPAERQVGERDGLPVPPPGLWEGYGQTPEQYLGGGRPRSGS
ncbi:hypothetical protein [Tautonia plasticadhaerens]|nr:hypothetical protein [Tautonia plasticadhaerens]